MADSPHGSGRGRTNLPAPLSSFVGRAQEIRSAVEHLRDRDARLLTLTGSGGSGKTRLAFEIAAALADDYEHGVVFVPLESVRDPTLVPSAIMEALGLQEAPGSPLLRQLEDHLQSRQLLLLLDNFEQVAVAAPVVSGLLRVCPRLKVLVTSRAVLHLSGEHEFPVPPLSLPARSAAEREAEPSAVLAESEAVQLFLTRARAARPDLALRRENTEPVGEICRRLDGLPLAIELAAARVRLLAPAALLTRLERRFDLLTGGPRDLPSRQQTLRGAIGWSYDLLTPAEQGLLQRLAVFVGGCTLDAAEAVCSGPEDSSLDLLEGIASLVDQSLLQKDERPTGEPRFRMLETVREYGLEQLLASGEMGSVQQRHAGYFLALAEEMDARWRGPEPHVWMDRLEAELGNLRAVLAWCLTESGDTELGLRLAGALWRFWDIRGHLREGREWLARMLVLPDASGYPAARARALNAAGYLAAYLSDHLDARQLHEQSLSLWRQLSDRRGIAMALYCLSIASKWSGDRAGELAFLEESLALAREIGDRVIIYIALYNLALRATADGDYERAVALHEASLALKREQGDIWSIANSSVSLGQMALRQGDHARAMAEFQEAMPVYQKMGDPKRTISCLESLACVAAARGLHERAARLLGAAEANRETLGTQREPHVQRNYDQAQSSSRDALGELRFADAWTAGRAIPLAEAVAYALTAAEPAAATDGSSPPLPPLSYPDGLSAREVEVLGLLAEGRSNKEIAAELVVSVRTVESHRASIYDRTGARSRGELVAYAQRQGLTLPRSAPS